MTSDDRAAGPVPSRAKVVVVGGGIIGCSIAYHLAKIGIGDVVLLERKQLTCGTTWHAAGLVFDLRTRSLTRLGKYAIELFRSIEDETEQSTGLKKIGRVALALNEARREVVLRSVSLAGDLDVEARMLSNAELAERWPLLNIEGVAAAAYFPNSAKVNPVDATQAFAKGARKYGARVLEHTKVTKILTRNGRVAGVETEAGAIEAEFVVLASGMWTRALAASVGVNVPLHAVEHFYIISEPIAGLSPDTPNLGCPDERAYYREDAGKLLVGTFEPEAKPWGTEGIPEDFEFGTLPVDLDHYAEFLENAADRVPILKSAGIRTFFTGPESFTPDNRHLMGEAPELRNLFICAGLCSSGIMSAPGHGKVMAEWIRDASPPFGLFSLDVRRMLPFQGTRRYLYDRNRESQGLSHDIPWPGKQMRTARGTRRLPVHRELLEAGAVMGERIGWEVPLWYTKPGETLNVRYKMGHQDWFPAVRAECVATRDAVALYDQSFFGKLLVQGPDACRVLNWISANDVDVAPGRVVYTQWLNPRGGIEADLTVNRLSEDTYLVLTGPPGQLRDLDWIKRHMPENARVAVTDVTSAYAMFGVMGPNSRALLQGLSDADLANAAFPFATSREIDLGYALVRATRLTYVGELGFELVVSSDMAAHVHERLIEAGKEFGLRHAGLYAQAACRLERGYRHLGHDIDEDETPLGAGLGFAVKWEKPGGFLGREALLGQRGSGVLSRRLVQLRLQDASATSPILEHDEPIWRDGKRVGATTSGGWGFRLEASLGMGFVNHPGGVSEEWLAAGRFEVEVAMERHPTLVQLRSFYDPTGQRVRM